MNVAPFELPSVVHFDSLREIRSAGESYLADRVDGAVFDLSPLKECNTVAVALLMAWLRYAHARDIPVVYAGAPADLLNIIDVVGLTDTLPLERNQE